MKYVLKFSGSPLTSEQTDRNHRRRALFIPGGTDREQALYIKRNSHSELFSIGFKYDSDNGRRDCKLTYEYEAQFDCRENQDDFEFFIRSNVPFPFVYNVFFLFHFILGGSQRTEVFYMKGVVINFIKFTGVFLRILRNFQKHLSYRTPLGDYICMLSSYTVLR